MCVKERHEVSRLGRGCARQAVTKRGMNWYGMAGRVKACQTLRETAGRTEVSAVPVAGGKLARLRMFEKRESLHAA